MFADAITAALASARDVASTAITYRRAGGVSVALWATPTRPEFRDGGDEEVLAFEARDYLLAAADLVLDGAATLPAAGDTIEETIQGVLHTFQVLPIDGEHHFRFMDPYHLGLRVHTKRIE